MRNLLRIPLLLSFAATCCCCSARHFRADPGGKPVDSIFTYRNDAKGLSLFFGHYHTQHGFIPPDRFALRIFSRLGLNLRKDTLLYSGCMFACLERRSEPPYLKETRRHPISLDHHRHYLQFTVLDTLCLPEWGYRYTKERIRQECTPEMTTILSTTKFTRKVFVLPGQRMVIIEDRIPYRDHCISMIYVRKQWNGREEALHGWKGGGNWDNPASPDNMMSGRYDYGMRVTRDNAIGLLLRDSETYREGK